MADLIGHLKKAVRFCHFDQAKRAEKSKKGRLEIEPTFLVVVRDS